MTIKELIEELSIYPDNMEVAIDDDGIYMAIDYVEYDDRLLLIGNADGFMYQQ